MYSNMQALLDRAHELSAELTAHRRFFHENAEIGFENEKTRGYIEKELKKMGYIPRKCGSAGLVATVGDTRCGKALLLRADMDALPIREESGLDFSAKNKNMHACGHDLHSAMLLGAAKLLRENEKGLNGCVKLAFQPAEETLEGAINMIEDGLLDAPAVDAAMMIHVASGIEIPTGRVIVPSGGVGAPSADHFCITVHGRGCHGSTPNLGVDAIMAAAHILIGLGELSARELSISERAVLTVGKLYGGDAPNAIAETATLMGTLRTFDEATRKRLKSRVSEISEGLAAAFRANAEVKFERSCPTFLNDSELCEFAKLTAARLLGANSVLTPNNQRGEAGGSEDFAYVSHRVPTVVLSLAAGEIKRGYEYPLHHPKVKFDESALPIGAALYAYFAISWLG